jgi:Tol biopolymer transport system component
LISRRAAFDTKKTFGGDEDYIWSPDSKRILYVSKEKQALLQYAASTNTNIYEYNLQTGKLPIEPKTIWV